MGEVPDFGGSPDGDIVVNYRGIVDKIILSRRLTRTIADFLLCRLDREREGYLAAVLVEGAL